MPEDKNNGVLGNPDLFGKQIKAIPVPEKNIGIDTDNILYDNIINAVKVGQIDMTSIESFTQMSQSRNLIYDVLDIMAEDTTISSMLEIYAEDATEANESGHIVWAESDQTEISNYINFLLDELNVDKNVYKWVYSLCKYGDVYLRLLRNSDYRNVVFKTRLKGILDTNERDILEEKEDRQELNEDINIKAYSSDDKYAHYVEMVPNPAEMFELTLFGKTYGYIQAPSITAARTKQTGNLMYSTYQYYFQKKDVNIYEGTEFVHGCLEDNSSRVPEKVSIYQTDADMETDTNGLSFTVRRGQSLLYNAFKSWRNLMLLENSLLLNRLTKSSIVRIINVEVGDMPKENVGPHLLGIKQLIEQKTAINTNNSLQEYTNPGPMENNVYVPTHNGLGTISTQQVGGDVDVRSIVDIDYFKDKFYSSMKIPKQYLGDTEDSTGFNGGTSLSLISSRYAKTVKKIQNVIIQMLNDAINLFLLDKGLESYINKFELHMVTPMTSEEMDRRDNMDNKIGIVNNIMGLLDGIDDASQKLRILKSLLANVITDQEVINVLQEEIDKLKEQEEAGIDTTEEGDEFEPSTRNFHEPSGSNVNIDLGGDRSEMEIPSPETSGGTEEIGELPTADSLGLDMTDANLEI